MPVARATVLQIERAGSDVDRTAVVEDASVAQRDVLQGYGDSALHLNSRPCPLPIDYGGSRASGRAPATRAACVATCENKSFGAPCDSSPCASVATLSDADLIDEWPELYSANIDQVVAINMYRRAAQQTRAVLSKYPGLAAALG